MGRRAVCRGRAVEAQLGRVALVLARYGPVWQGSQGKLSSGVVGLGELRCGVMRQSRMVERGKVCPGPAGHGSPG